MDDQSNIGEKMKQMVHSVIDLKKQVEKEFEKISTEENCNKNATILIGPSGSGKTTLYYALTNKTIKNFNDENCIRMITEEPDDKFIIDQYGLEDKKIGIKYNSSNGVIFCDIPGFFGNNNDIQDIINSFALYFILEHVNYVKILLVVSSADIMSIRGFQLKKICQIIENQFPKQDELQSSICLVITNTKNGNMLLNNVDCENSWLLKYFKDNEKESSNVVFHLPAQEYSDKQIFNNEEIDKIRSFIQKSNTNTLKSRISLSSESKLMILNGINFCGDIRLILREFIDLLYIEISKSDENLLMWKNRIKEIEKCKFNKPNDFIEKCREIIITPTCSYESIYDGMALIQIWQEFLEPILFTDSENKDEMLRKKRHLLEPVFADISSWLNFLLFSIEYYIDSRYLANMVSEVD